MIGNVGRRAVESLIGLFALLGFAYVPLGSKTGLEHTLAVIRTPPAQQAIAGLISTFALAKDKVMATLLPAIPTGTPLPLPTPDARGPNVKPLVPRLGDAHQRDTTR